MDILNEAEKDILNQLEKNLVKDLIIENGSYWNDLTTTKISNHESKYTFKLDILLTFLQTLLEKDLLENLTIQCVLVPIFNEIINFASYTKNLSIFHIELYEMNNNLMLNLVDALKHNSSIKKISLHIKFYGVGLIDIFASFLGKNKSIKKLKIADRTKYMHLRANAIFLRLFLPLKRKKFCALLRKSLEKMYVLLMQLESSCINKYIHFSRAGCLHHKSNLFDELANNNSIVSLDCNLNGSGLKILDLVQFLEKNKTLTNLKLE